MRNMTTQAQARLCGCLLDAANGQLPWLLRHPQLDLVEWRLDAFISRHGLERTRTWLDALSAPDRHPVLVTNRAQRHGGFFAGSEDLRIALLREAVELGADWVDLEEDVPPGVLQWFFSQPARTLISHHDFARTPEPAALQRLARGLATPGAHGIKIATQALAAEDPLRVLELIPWGRRELGVEVIAFGMGPLGRWSRVVSALLGSPWSYVKFPDQPEAAPGQVTAAEMRALWEMLA
jgi:3-dehydroquinate dehydratase I